MTYNITIARQGAMKRYAITALVGMLGIGLTGCGTSGGILSSDNSAAKQNVPTALAPSTQSARAKIAIAPIIGAPDKISRQLTSSLTQAIAAQRVLVARTKDEAVDYTLRGYVVAAREANSTKLSYIWDVTDPSGKRVNRITGEQTITGSTNRDPWVSVSPAIVQTIADKTASSFGTWLPSKPAAQAIASNKKHSQLPTPVGTVPRGGATTTSTSGSLTPPAIRAALKPAAGAQKVLAYVPFVSGAPGDGRVSLTNALKKELKRGGVTLVQSASAATHHVVGRVAVGKGAGGKQPIKIDWTVRDPRGTSLGSVSQKNDIPTGSLNGPWGKIADAAAGAAAQGILKLLPKTTLTR